MSVKVPVAVVPRAHSHDRLLTVPSSSVTDAVSVDPCNSVPETVIHAGASSTLMTTTRTEIRRSRSVPPLSVTFNCHVVVVVGVAVRLVTRSRALLKEL